MTNQPKDKRIDQEKKNIYAKIDSIIRVGDASSYIGEDDMVSLVKGGIAIYFHIKNDKLDIINIYRTAKRVQKKIKEAFGHDLKKIDISLYHSIAELRQDVSAVSQYGSWIAGIYDNGKIRVISENEGNDPESLYITLTHEIVHLAISEIGNNKCPYWLDEGLAIYFSQNLSDTYADALKEAVKKDAVIPLERLENPLPAETDENIIRLAYAQSSGIVSFLIEKFGMDRIGDIIKQCRHISINKILCDELSSNYDLIEMQWKRWMRSNIA